MSDRPRSKPLEMRDFPGIVLQADAHDLPLGSGQDQLNVKSDQSGSMSVRDGMSLVSFDSTS